MKSIRPQKHLQTFVFIAICCAGLAGNLFAEEPLALKLAVWGPTFALVRVTNTSPDEDVRIWEQNNSWGDRTFSFLATTEAGRKHHLFATPREYGRNIPQFDEIHPGKSADIRLNFLDHHWAWAPPLDIADKIVAVTATLSISKTVQAVEKKVLLGTWTSPEVKIAE